MNLSTRMRSASVALPCAGLLVVGGIIAATLHTRYAVANATTAMTPGTAPHKQLYHCGMHPQVVEDHPDDCPICHMALTPMNDAAATTTGAMTAQKVLYWWDPMLGTTSISDHPGKSAMGMEMVPVYADSTSPEVRIDPTVVQNMGIRTARVTREALHETIRVAGIIKLPEPSIHDLTLKVGGWIDHLYADQEGMHVTKGEALFDMYSQDLQVAAQELISAVAGEKALPSAASEDLRRQARGFVESARRKLALWDIADQDIDMISRSAQPPKDIPIRSPASGHIKEKMIVEGSAVQPMTRLLRVEDHSRMWLEAQVYSEQIPLLKLGQPVQAMVEGASAEPFTGIITFIAPHLDAMTRSLTIRAELDNSNLALKPGMYARVDILARPMDSALQIPREAVIDTGTRQIVFVVNEPGHFAARSVSMGLAADDDQVQIVAGLSEGDTVVTSGQFLLDVESRTLEATQKLTEKP